MNASTDGRLGPAVPVLRIFDVPSAVEFYCDYLGFTLGGEHRSEPDSPAYLFLSWSQTVLHLSEHYGDGSPNTVVWIPVANVYALHRRLGAQRYRYARPGVEDDAPGGPTMTVTDPFGNELRFCQHPG